MIVRTRSHVFDEDDDWDIHKQRDNFWYVVVGPDHFDHTQHLNAEGTAVPSKPRILFPSLEEAEDAVALYLLKRSSLVQGA